MGDGHFLVSVFGFYKGFGSDRIEHADSTRGIDALTHVGCVESTSKAMINDFISFTFLLHQQK